MECTIRQCLHYQSEVAQTGFFPEWTSLHLNKDERHRSLHETGNKMQAAEANDDQITAEQWNLQGEECLWTHTPSVNDSAEWK